MGGMVTATALGVFFVPVFFVVVRSLFKGSARQHEADKRHAEAAGITEEKAHD
jgi:multidrug efflux pump